LFARGLPFSILNLAKLGRIAVIDLALQEFYSNDPSVDKIRAVSEQIDSVKATMVKNLGM
jgi:hypothetical protein